MKFLLLTLLLSSAVTANQCTPKKSNPKNEQCATDLMKDGIESLPEDLQSQMMEPLVRKLAKKLMKDMLDDTDCQQDKPQQCSGTSDPGDIEKPSSEGGKKMFEQAGKNLQENKLQLVNEAKEKIVEMGKDLKDEVAGEFKNLIKDSEFSNSPVIDGAISDLLGNAENALDDALGGATEQFGGAIEKVMDGAGKATNGLKNKVTEMPKAGLDFINKQLKGKNRDLLNKTLGAFKGQVKGLMAGFIGGLAFDEIKNATGLAKKMKWLKKKLSAIVNDYGAQFGIRSKAVTEGVFTDFVATMPAEMRVNDSFSWVDLGLIFLHPIFTGVETNSTGEEGYLKEDAYHNMTHITDLLEDVQETEVEAQEELSDISDNSTVIDVNLPAHEDSTTMSPVFHNYTGGTYNATTVAPTTAEATTTDEVDITTEESTTTEDSWNTAITTTPESSTPDETTTAEPTTTSSASPESTTTTDEYYTSSTFGTTSEY